MNLAAPGGEAPTRDGAQRDHVPGGSRSGPILLGAMVGSLIAGRIETATLCLIAAALAGWAAGARDPGRRWMVLIGSGALLSMALNLYLVRGAPLPLPAVFGLGATAEGLRAGVLLAIKLAGAALALHGLRAAWPGERAADEGARILRPLERLGVPVKEARTVLGLALRFVPLLGAEAQRIARLQELRSGRPARGLRERLQRRRAAAVPTLVSALERAEHVALALEARHYRVRPISAPVWPQGATAAGATLAAAALLWRG